MKIAISLSAFICLQTKTIKHSTRQRTNIKVNSSNRKQLWDIQVYYSFMRWERCHWLEDDWPRTCLQLLMGGIHPRTRIQMHWHTSLWILCCIGLTFQASLCHSRPSLPQKNLQNFMHVNERPRFWCSSFKASMCIFSPFVSLWKIPQHLHYWTLFNILYEPLTCTVHPKLE